MPRRAPVFAACLAFGALGLTAGLAAFRRLLTLPLARYDGLFPVPRAAAWAGALHRPADLLDGLGLPLRVATILLLLAALWLLGKLLNPSLRLLKPPEQNEGAGVSAHLDLPRLLRAGAAALLSLWLLGLFSPLAALGPSRGLAGALVFLLAGGLPVWTSPLGGVPGALAHSILLCLLLWSIWGPRGLLSDDRKTGWSEVLCWGLLAGIAAVPAVLGAYQGQLWIQQAAGALSLANRSGWRWLLILGLAVPMAAAPWLALVAAVYRPRPLAPGCVRGAGLGALAVLVLTAAAGAILGGLRRRIDAEAPGLARLLRLEASPLRRFVLILAPDRQSVFSTAPDGSDDGTGRDRIACNGATVTACEQFLRQRGYQSVLVPRAYEHLYACASLDWLTTHSMEVNLATLEGSPAPVPAQRLLEKLADCPITPENRRLLDTLADPARFQWPEPRGRRWLTAAYLRFGDASRARTYLRTADMSNPGMRSMISGITPLAEGTVEGRISVQGREAEGVRLGLVRVDKWKQMAGFCRPEDWGQVSGVAYSGPGGKFTFTSMPEGDYVLALTGGGIGLYGGQAVVTHAPGLIRLDRFHSRQVLKPLDIRFTHPLKAPDEGPPGSTAARAAPAGA
jgi:hypothetical protein